jgi:hypothetical protein
MKLTLLAYITNMKIWIAAALLQVSPINNFISKYIFSDYNFLKWLVIVMILDLITGITKIIKHQGMKAVTSKGLRDTVSKCIQYAAFLIVTNVLTHYEIDGQPAMSNMTWLSKLAYEFILLIEIKSVYENIVAYDARFDFMAKIVKKIIDMLPTKYKTDKNENSKPE